MRQPSSDILFARDDAHRMLPLMVACLVGFSALLLMVAFSLSNNIQTQASDVYGTLQIELSSDTNASTLDNVIALLKRTEGVQDVVVVGKKQMEGLLKPWLGSNLALDDLALPVMLDVKTAVANDKTTVDVLALSASLEKISKGALVEDRGPWLDHMAQALQYVQAVVLFIASALMLCMIAMIVLVSRTSLKLHFKTVSLLHMFGATDDYILRQFQMNSAWLAGRGALLGIVFTVLIMGFAVIATQQWESPILPALTITTSHILSLIVLPVLTALVAWVATRLTVQSMLAQMH
ncbi:MAG: cell division protein FtsX [Rickettsiales bacterium]